MKVDTDRLNEIAEEYAAMEVCTETSSISVEVDETFCYDGQHGIERLIHSYYKSFRICSRSPQQLGI